MNHCFLSCILGVPYEPFLDCNLKCNVAHILQKVFLSIFEKNRIIVHNIIDGAQNTISSASNEENNHGHTLCYQNSTCS